MDSDTPNEESIETSWNGKELLCIASPMKNMFLSHARHIFQVLVAL